MKIETTIRSTQTVKETKASTTEIMKEVAARTTSLPTEMFEEHLNNTASPPLKQHKESMKCVVTFSQFDTHQSIKRKPQ